MRSKEDKNSRNNASSMAKKNNTNNKNRKRAKKNNRQKGLAAILVIILLIFLGLLWKLVSMLREVDNPSDRQNASKVQAQEKELEKVPEKALEKESLKFPYSLDDGKLVVDSLFQSSIANPDYNNEIAEDIASIEVWNQSDLFLTSAQITIVLEGGTELLFELQDVPAGGKVWAFETGNRGITAQPICENIKCDASYEETMPIMAEQLSFEASGTDVTISNLTGMDLTGLNISFHCLFDGGVYYGGKTCTYPIEALPAGGNISLNVQECYLGTAEAVRATQE